MFSKKKIIERKYASQNLVESLLPSIDQLRIVVGMPTDNDLLRNYLIGFKMINDQIFQALESDGLKEVKAVNEVFDPNFHYAIEKISDKEKTKRCCTTSNTNRLHLQRKTSQTCHGQSK